MKRKLQPLPDEGWHSWKTRYNADGTMQLIHMSAGMEALYGYNAEELRDPEAWRRLIPDEELPKIEEANEAVLSEGWWHGRVRIKPKEGDILVLEMVSMIESSDDGVTVVAGRLRDVSERARLESRLEEQEARLKILNEQLRLVMWSCDVDLRFTWSWGSGLRDLGLQDNDAVGMTLFEYFETEDDDFPPIAAERRALSGEHISYEFAWRGREYRCTVDPHLGPLGDVIGTIGTAIDITDQQGPTHERVLEKESAALGRELSAPRISAEARWQPPSEDSRLVVGPVSINLDAFEVRRDDEVVELTPTEFRLLVELASRAGMVVQHDALLHHVWGHDFLGSRSLITMAVRRLRAKIEDDPAHPLLIETVRGIGYRFRGDLRR